MSFISQLSWRSATKKFDPAKPVSQESLDTVLESIRMAPTSYGLQPFHLTVVSNQELKEKLKGAAWGQEQLSSAPYTIVFSARTDLSARIEEYMNLVSGGNAEVRAKLKTYEDMMTSSLSNLSLDSAKAWSAKQAYIALGFGMAACAEISLDSCPMEGFDAVEYKKILNLPENLDPVVLLTLGYRSEGEKPRPKIRFPREEIITTIA